MAEYTAQFSRLSTAMRKIDSSYIELYEKLLELDSRLCYFKFRIFYGDDITPIERTLSRTDAYKTTAPTVVEVTTAKKK